MVAIFNLLSLFAMAGGCVLLYNFGNMQVKAENEVAKAVYGTMKWLVYAVMFMGGLTVLLLGEIIEQLGG